MKDELLSARFDSLLKRYKEKLELLDLDLPAPTEAPSSQGSRSPLPERAAPGQTHEEPAAPDLQEEAPAAPVMAEPPAPVPAPEPPSTPEPGPAAMRPPPEPSLPAESEPLEPELPVWETPAMRESGPQPRPAPAPARTLVPAPRRRLWLAGLVLVPLAATLWWGYSRLAGAPDYRAFSLSRASVRGLTWREGKLVVADADDRFLLLYDTQGRRLDSKESINAPDIEDIAWVDGTFWSTAQGRSAIFQHDPGPEHGVRRIYATPNRLPAALSGDNENLWAADAQASVLYRYLIGHSLNGVSLTPLNQYNLAEAPAVHLCAAEGRLWLLDSRNRRLMRYNYDAGTLAPIDSAELGARIPAGTAIKGLVVGGDFLWVLTAEPAVLHRFSLKSLSWRFP